MLENIRKNWLSHCVAKEGAKEYSGRSRMTSIRNWKQLWKTKKDFDTV